MFPIVFEVELQGVMVVRDRRRFKRLIKLAMRATLFFWHERFLRLHFNRTAFFRYGAVYTKRKSRRGGNPNVLTGRMKRMLEQVIRVTGTEKLMTGTMKGPAYTDVRRPGQPDKAREISFVNSGEQRQMARFLQNLLGRSLQRERSVRKRVRISA